MIGHRVRSIGIAAYVCSLVIAPSGVLAETGLPGVPTPAVPTPADAPTATPPATAAVTQAPGSPVDQAGEPIPDGLPESDRASDPIAEIVDVAVEDGTLVGEVRNRQGRLLAGRQVTVLFAGTEVASTKTGVNGTFRVTGIREGVHAVVCCEQTACIRVWSKETAPPQSGCAVCIVCDECENPVARQQRQPTRRTGRLARALACYPIATVALLGAGIGTAIAVPIATSQKPASP